MQPLFDLHQVTGIAASRSKHLFYFVPLLRTVRNSNLIQDRGAGASTDSK